MQSNSLLDSLISWLLDLSAAAVCLMLGLLCLLLIMMACPLIIDWLGVRSHRKANTTNAYRPEEIPQKMA